MKIWSASTRQVYEIEVNGTGENNQICPECSHNRKKKDVKCFSWNTKKDTGYCIHCDGVFYEYKPFEEKEYVKPVEAFTDLRPEWQKRLLETRAIGLETIKKLKISEKNVWIPQLGEKSDAVAFPFYRNGELINCKYRAQGKNFTLEKGAELIFYNYDQLVDNKEVIITEGEFDTASFVEEGFDNCISVPNGAEIKKMEYFESAISDLDKVEKFYIAVDNDPKGIELRDELIRRLGADRCWIVTFGEHKDANDCLVHAGRGVLAERLKAAKQPKVEGALMAEDMLSDLQDLFKNGLQKGQELGFAPLDNIITWETGLMCVIHGTPSSGKSELTDDICCRLNIQAGWKTVFWSPENLPIKRHYAKIYERLVGNRFKESETGAEFWNTYEHINDNFFWVNPDSTNNLQEVLDKFLHFIKVKGVKIVVLDPLNMVAAGLDYMQQDLIIAEMAKFARVHNVLFILVAHPRKLDKDKSTKLYSMPSPYEIAGSSGIYNRSGYIIGMLRVQDLETLAFLPQVEIATQKIKFKQHGKQDLIKLDYTFLNGRYETENTPDQLKDKTNWLNPNAKLAEVVSKVDNNSAINAFEGQSRAEDWVKDIYSEEEIPF